MLRGIAVYSCQENEEHLEFKKIQSAQKSKMAFFSENEFENMDSKTMPSFVKGMQCDKIHHVTVKDEHHYLIRMSQDKDTVIGLVTNKKLQLNECSYLFRNIHVVLKHSSIATRLEDIVINPVGYTGRDVLVDKTQKEVKAVRDSTFQLIEKVLERGERIFLNSRCSSFS